MELAYAFLTPTIFHLGAINALSMIAGRYRKDGWRAVRSLTLLPVHLAGLGFMAAAILCFVIGQRVGTPVPVVAGGGFMLADLICISLAVRRAN